MASISAIAERRWIKREENERKLGEIASKLGVTLEEIDPSNWGLKDQVMLEYAHTRFYGQMIAVLEAQQARIDALQDEVAPLKPAPKGKR
jgi:hypothetical protein